MKTFVLIALCLAAVSAVPRARKHHAVPVKDMPIFPGEKIVGGVETAPHQYPHQVALYSGGSFNCGGSIIRERWVLTAAHCSEGNPSQYEVQAGAHDRTASEATQQRRGVTKVIIHPGWNSATLANDVALWEVDEAFVWDENVQPGVLATARPTDGSTVWPSGWGRLENGNLPPLLRHVDVPVISVADCAAVYGSIITPNIICIDGAGGKSTCNGDSGGPLNYDGTIVGVVSFGSSAGCAVGYPAGFSNMASYTAWVNENIPPV